MSPTPRDASDRVSWYAAIRSSGPAGMLQRPCSTSACAARRPARSTGLPQPIFTPPRRRLPARPIHQPRPGGVRAVGCAERLAEVERAAIALYTFARRHGPFVGIIHRRHKFVSASTRRATSCSATSAHSRLVPPSSAPRVLARRGRTASTSSTCATTARRGTGTDVIPGRDPSLMCAGHALEVSSGVSRR